jgi:uncharacterized protein (DUF697 family)
MAAEEALEQEGWTNGRWFLRLIRRYFKKYWETLEERYFHEVYGTDDKDAIANRLIKTFSRNASLLGALTGLIMSADEIVTFLTGAEGGMGLPFNIAIAVLVLTMETILLLRFQLALVACLGRLYGAPLDPDDPDDLATIMTFAVGGSAANAAGAAGIKVGGKLAARVARKAVQKEALTMLADLAERIGIRMFARAIVKYALPVVSVAIGMVMNYLATKAVGVIAMNHFRYAKKHAQTGK